MIELVLGLTVMAGVALALPAVVRRHRGPQPETHHLWAVAQANTSDGMTARLSVEFVAVVGADFDANAVVDTVEDLLRHQIATSAAHQLPSIGDTLADLADHVPVGMHVEQTVVASSEIEVTPEFRRLIGARD